MIKFITIALILLLSIVDLCAEREVNLKKTVQISGRQVLLSDLLVDTSSLKDEEKNLVILESPLRGFKNYNPVDIAYEMQVHKSLLDLSLVAPPPFVKVMRIKDAGFVEKAKEGLIEALKKESPWKLFELGMEFTPTDLTKLSSMSGTEFEVLNQRPNAELSSAKIIVKFTEKGKDRGSLTLNPIMSRKVLAITLKNDITKGRVIKKSDLVLDRVWVSGTDERFAANFQDCIGFEAGKNMSAGSRIIKSFLIEPIYVEKGQYLTVSSGSPYIQAEVVAKALSTGRRGDVIRVMNTKSQRYMDVVMTGMQTAIAKVRTK